MIEIEIREGNEFVRHTDPETSHIAAEGNPEGREVIEVKLLRAYAHAGGWDQDGLTDEEALIQAGYDLSRDGARRRCSTLREKGQIVPVYRDGVRVRRLGRSGFPRDVCTITEAGAIRLDELDGVG